MKRKIYIFCLAAVMLLGLASFSVYAAPVEGSFGWEDDNEFQWTLENGTLTIIQTVYTEADQTIGIPGFTDDIYVRPCPWEAYKSEIEKVVIGEGISTIGGNAFKNCENLKEVIMPPTIEDIGPSAFENCVSLESIDLSSVTFFERNAFAYCTSLTEIDFTDAYCEFHIGSFSGCTGLTEIVLSNEGSRIKQDAFTGCTGLKIVDLANVWDIDPAAFNNCPNIEEFKVFEDCYAYQSVDGVIYTTTGYRLVRYPAARAGDSYDIIDQTIHIYSHAFDSCTLKSIYIPDTVKKIDGSAFANCYGLESIVIPNSVNSLGVSVFENCPKLKSAVISSSLERVPHSCFLNCVSLREIYLPDSINWIEYSAFSNTGFESFSVPHNVTNLNGQAFENCTKLKTVNIGDGLDVVDWNCFAGCTALESVSFGNALIAINANAFGGCTSLKSLEFTSDAPYIEDYDVSPLPEGVKLSVSVPEGSSGWDAEPWTEHVIRYVNYDISFSDVAEGTWYYDTIMSAAKAGIIAGNADGTFAPKLNLSWAQAITFAVRLNQYIAGEHVYGVSDQGSVWYDIYLVYAKDRGIIADYPDNPNAPITRGDAAIIFAAVLGEAEKVNDLPQDYFADVSVEDEAYGAVYKLAQAGICNGKKPGEFGISDYFVRSEVATIVARMAGLVPPAII